MLTVRICRDSCPSDETINLTGRGARLKDVVVGPATRERWRYKPTDPILPKHSHR